MTRQEMIKHYEDMGFKVTLTDEAHKFVKKDVKLYIWYSLRYIQFELDHKGGYEIKTFRGEYFDTIVPKIDKLLNKFDKRLEKIKSSKNKSSKSKDNFHKELYSIGIDPIKYNVTVPDMDDTSVGESIDSMLDASDVDYGESSDEITDIVPDSNSESARDVWDRIRNSYINQLYYSPRPVTSTSWDIIINNDNNR